MIGHASGLLVTDGEEMRAEKDREEEKTRAESRKDVMAGTQAQHIRTCITNTGRWLETHLHMCFNIHVEQMHTAYKITVHTLTCWM